MLAGLLSALISVTAWGSYFVPMKRVKKYDPFYFQLIMCLTILVSSLILVVFLQAFKFTYFGIISGIFWSSGNILSALAVQKAGLSKSAPIWMGTGIIISSLWGLAFFHEALTNQMLGIVGIILIILGILWISRISENTKEGIKLGSVRNGIFLALVAGLFFGTYFVPFKLSGFDPFSYLLSSTLGIFLGGICIYAVKRSPMDRSIIKQGALSGLLWNVGNIASFFAVASLGLTVGFPLTQLALFVSILWGLMYFKEIKSRKNIISLVLSGIVLFTGAILLTLAK